jgi:hypothetical protein
MVPFEPFGEALKLLDVRLSFAQAPRFRLVVCGGTALVAMGLHERTTRDVDIVAIADHDGRLVDPAPLPVEIARAAREVADDLGLPEDWLNNGPSSGDGGLFRLGLPAGIGDRLTWRTIGPQLDVAFIGRLDQIHFKLYAAVDQSGSYHATDLDVLDPTDDELLAAIVWARSHDPSPGFRECVRTFLQEFGHGHLLDRV